MAKMWLFLIVVLLPFLLSAESIRDTSESEVSISTSPVYSLADEYYKNKNYDRAIEEYRILLSSKNYDSFIHRKMASCYMRLGLYRNAVEQAELHLRKTGHDRNTTWLLAHLSNRMGNYKKSMKYLERYRRESKRSDARYYMEMGRCLAETGKLHEAIKMFESVLQAPGGDDEVRLLARCFLSYLYRVGGNYTHAKDEARQALKISEELSAPYRMMGAVYCYEGNLGEALSWTYQAIGKKYDTVDSKFLLYEIYKEMKNTDSADLMLKESKAEVRDTIAKSGREDGTLHAVMAYILIEEKDFENALQYARKALKFKPNYGSNCMMGYYYFKTGADNKARAYFEKSKRLNPIYFDAYEYLSKIHRRAGRFAAAQKEVDAALKINPSNRFILAEAEKIKNRQRED